jgi:hypothetical protein
MLYSITCLGIVGIYTGIFNLMNHEAGGPLFGIGGFFLFFAGLVWPTCRKPLPTVRGEIVSETEATVVVTGEPV